MTTGAVFVRIGMEPTLMTTKTVLVNFCIFGDDKQDIYYRGALKNAVQYAEHHPEWRLRFYLGDSVPKELEFELLDANILSEFVRTGFPEDQTATAWRFLAIRDKRFDYYLFRDVDSRLTLREREAVREWMDDGEKNFHVMRDHPYHNVPMLAGMWGCNAMGANTIRHKIPTRLEHDFYQVDQRFLSRYIWRIARRSMMIHADAKWPWDRLTEVRRFPTVREGREFVGEGFYGDDTPRFPQHRECVVGHGMAPAGEQLSVYSGISSGPGTRPSSRTRKSSG